MHIALNPFIKTFNKSKLDLICLKQIQKVQSRFDKSKLDLISKHQINIKDLIILQLLVKILSEFNYCQTSIRICHIMYSFFKKKPIIQNNNKAISEQYEQLRTKLALPLKMKVFFQILQNCTDQLVEKHKIPKQIADVYKPFSKSFIKLSSDDKYYFMLAMAKIVQHILADHKGKQGFQNLQYTSKIENIETSCKVRDLFVGLSMWEDKIFKYINHQKLIKLYTNNHSNQQKTFHLENYHLRISTKEKNTVVLQAIFEIYKIPQKYQNYYIYFKDKAVFNQIYRTLRNTIIMTWKKRLIGLLNSPQQVASIQKQNIPVASGPQILNSKSINEYFKTKQKIQSKIVSRKVKFKVISEVRKIKICRASKYDNFYKVQNTIDALFEDVLKNTQLINRVPMNKLVHYQKMQNFNNTISAVYYKYVVKGCTHDMLSMVQQNFKQNQCKITYKAIQNFTVQKNLEFLQIKILRLGDGKTKMIVIGFMNFQDNIKLNIISVIDFLLSLAEYRNQQQSSKQLKSNSKTQKTFQVQSSKMHQEQADYAQPQNEEDEDDFQTVNGQNFDSDEDRQLQNWNTFPSPKRQVKSNQQNQSQDEQTQQQRNLVNEFRAQKSCNSINNFEQYVDMEVNEFDYLRKKSFFEPQKPTQNLLKKHYFQGEWGKYQKGGVFSLNTVLIDKQKQIFKSLLARMGNALLKKSFTNLSLPVIVFKPESQLQTIARNLSYAPLLLQNMSDKPSLQRMKKSIVVMISMGTIGLSLQKPFNPILGQTFQGYIDNCPIYMQQIQHHPPITTMCFFGRGYKIYGSILPIVSIRLNSVKCYSQSPLKIKWDNQQTITFTPGRMLIGGCLVGDRTFDFTDATYLWDETNKLITEVNVGPKKKFTKNVKGDKNDFVWGYIYKVTDLFMTLFLSDGKKTSPSTQKSSKIMATIYGCWHQKIFINDQQVFDFETQLPYRLVRQRTPIKSDSSLRADIKFVAQDDLIKAQDQKDLVEEVQRNDARLRKKNKNQIK